MNKPNKQHFGKWLCGEYSIEQLQKLLRCQRIDAPPLYKIINQDNMKLAHKTYRNLH